MGATVAPDRLTQALTAKARADEIRSLRAQLRRDLAACGTRRDSLLMAARFTADPPWWLQRMTVGDLLLSCRGVKRTTVIRLCNEVPVSPLRDIGELAPRRREALVAYITTLAERRP